MEEDDAGVVVGGDAPGSVRLSGRRPPRRPGRGARARRRNLIVAGSMSALVLAGTGWVWATPQKIGSVDAGLSGTEQAPHGAMNILLVGVDKRDDLTRKEQNRLKLGREVGERTDTMMLIHLSEDHRKVTVVSLPRDTWTTIPGKGQHKINSAYQFGGAKLARQTVQQATGLPITRYIEVNVLGFVNVVDRLGGVTVCTPVPINDPKTGLGLAAGTHALDGAKALGYARTRATARSDLDRIDRQQQVISAMLSKALSNPANLISFVNSSLATIKVDPDDGLVPLVEQLKNVSLDDVKFASVPLADVNFKTPTGESAVLWDKARARRPVPAHRRRPGPRQARAEAVRQADAVAQDRAAGADHGQGAQRHAHQRARRAHQGGPGGRRVQGAGRAGQHHAQGLREDRRALRRGHGGVGEDRGRGHPRGRAQADRRQGHRGRRGPGPAEGGQAQDGHVAVHLTLSAGHAHHSDGKPEHLQERRITRRFLGSFLPWWSGHGRMVVSRWFKQ
ncbi:hypothetical protein GCM10020219_023770 [Nonomuraea dietziae]